MLLTPTFVGSLLAGCACWLLFWFGVSHIDSIPYLNKYLTRKVTLDWIESHPVTTLLLTEVVNVMFHGLGSAGAVFFTCSGTLTNTAVILFFLPALRWSSRVLDRAAERLEVVSSKPIELEAA
jgi:hypothetical protein